MEYESARKWGRNLAIASLLSLGGLGVAMFADSNFAKNSNKYVPLAVATNLYIPGLLMWKKSTDKENENSYRVV